MIAKSCFFRFFIISIIAISSFYTVIAANNPGHDSLYILKLGDNVTGNINVTGSFLANNLQTATLLYGSGLDIQANGTLITPSKPTIQSWNNDLYFDSFSGDIRFASQTGISNYIRFGTGSINVIVNGTLKQYDQSLCMQNGTNCPGSLGGANITGAGTSGTITKWTGTGTLGNSILTESGNTVTVSGNLTTTGNVTAINIYSNGAQVCTASNALCSSAVPYQSSAAGWTNTTTVTSTLFNVGVGTVSPMVKFQVNGSSNFTNGNVSVQSTYSLCFNANCTARMYHNGTALIIEGQ